MLPWVCSTPACPGLLVVVRFRADHRCCFLGCCSVLACSTSGSGELGCFRFRQIWLLFVFCRCFRTGCQSQARGGGGQPVLRSLCARSKGCGCFCLRLDFHVPVSVRGSQGTALAACLWHTDLEEHWGSGGFCVGMLPLACSTSACPGLLVVVRFRAVHRCCFLGCCFPQQGSPCG